MRSGSQALEVRSGFTLFEVVVGAGLLLMIGLILVQVLIPSLRATAESQRRAGMQQKASLVFRRLGSDLQDSVPSALSISTSPPVIAGQPISQFTNTAKVEFATELWAYFLLGDELRRVRWQSPGPPTLSVTLQASTPSRLPQTDLDKFPVTTIPRAQPLTDKVTGFTVTHGGVGSSVAGPITVELSLGGTTQETARVKMRRVFSPRLGE